VTVIDFVYQELPRLFCTHCQRLGHEQQNRIDIYLLNHQDLLLQNPPQVPIQNNPHALGPFIEPEYDDDYHQEMLYNVDIDEPDTDWSDWASTHIESQAISDQDRSEISFFTGEGYRQEGFHSDTSSASSSSIAETWLVEENGTFETQNVDLFVHSPTHLTEIQHNHSALQLSLSRHIKKPNSYQTITPQAQP
ncbi:hypothetical protein MKW92_021798, partial [Papaver armeniacum]